MVTGPNNSNYAKNSNLPEKSNMTENINWAKKSNLLKKINLSRNVNWVENILAPHKRGTKVFGKSFWCYRTHS